VWTGVFATAGDWALASDGLQWILLRRHRRRSGDGWDAISFVRTSKDILARCMREKGMEAGVARLLLGGLPDTFEEWKATLPASERV
jgi:hypothetical protein